MACARWTRSSIENSRRAARQGSAKGRFVQAAAQAGKGRCDSHQTHLDRGLPRPQSTLSGGTPRREPRLARVALRTTVLCAGVVLSVATAAETWRGLAVEPERRCSAYDPDHYSHPASIERAIVDRQGGVFSPYTLRRFNSLRHTDIEHIVAKAEAHDSGMCARSEDVRRGFARDLLNLTLASPDVNRRLKRAYDPAEWLPVENQCWYVRQWIRVKRKWQLSVDAAERESLSAVIEGCRRSSPKMRKP